MSRFWTTSMPAASGPMAETTVANIRDGWPENGIYIGRAGHGLDGYFGNPFEIGRDGNRDAVLVRYRRYLDQRLASGDIEFIRRLHALRGKVLVCFCKPLACHGDVIAEYLNGR